MWRRRGEEESRFSTGRKNFPLFRDFPQDVSISER
jgi:hypothetical protein